jgi:hypothetical protein
MATRTTLNISLPVQLGKFVGGLQQAAPGTLHTLPAASMRLV